ncbi:unnamed protein product [Withania somnifera]
MAEAAKYAPIYGGTMMSDMKVHLSVLKTKRTVACAYVFMFVFIVVTTFLAFSPSTNPSSPWFTNIFSISKEEEDNGSYRSQFSSVFSNFFTHHVQNPNADVVPTTSNNNKFEQPHLDKESSIGEKIENHIQNNDKVGVLDKSLNSAVLNDKESSETQSEGFDDKVGILKGNQSIIHVPKSPPTVNQSQSKDFDDKVGIVKAKQSTIEGPKAAAAVNQSQSKDFDDKVGILKANQKQNSVPKSSSEGENANGNGEKGIAEKEVKKFFTSSLVKEEINGTNLEKERDENLIKSLLNCDFFDGNWVRDESYPLYKPDSCSLIDEQFNCVHNDRPDSGYLKMKWKPKACSLPRLNGIHMLELLRGKRLVFVGDSLNRNMWESLICILKNSVKDQKKVYEEFGRHHFRTEASYSFIFKDYQCRVEFFVSPFLVQQWEVADKKGGKKETLRLDLMGEAADKYKDADILVFNTGHWWTHEKTSLGKDYYQEGSHVYRELNVLDAFRRAITTWGRWVDAHINPKKTFVLFRGYSPTHFSGGQWNSGGACDGVTEPIKNDTYLTPYPTKMILLENVFRGMKTQVSYLNITRMTDYRKDGHPSIYRQPNLTIKERKSQWRYQDCSHWCLPGVPDAWNELLYAQLLVRFHQKQQEKMP